MMLINIRKQYMEMALKEAQLAFDEDEVPVGAVIVRKGSVIAKAHNQIIKLKDPTAHAEMIAITQASNYLGSERLNACDMYVTIEPCSMCAGAMVLARIKTLYYAAEDPKTGAAGSALNVLDNNKLNHRVNVIPGLLREVSRKLIQDFFKAKRK